MGWRAHRRELGIPVPRPARSLGETRQYGPHEGGGPFDVTSKAWHRVALRPASKVSQYGPPGDGAPLDVTSKAWHRVQTLKEKLRMRGSSSRRDAPSSNANGTPDELSRAARSDRSGCWAALTLAVNDQERSRSSRGFACAVLVGVARRAPGIGPMCCRPATRCHPEPGRTRRRRCCPDRSLQAGTDR